MTHTVLLSYDDFPLGLTKFEHPNPKSVVVFNPAMGVPQHFYYDLAQHLHEHGNTVYTFDYRGLGASLHQKHPKIKAGYKEWTQDFESISNHIRAQHPNVPMHMIGHSFGGNSIGLSHAYKHYDKFLNVAAQYGYVKYFGPKFKFLIHFNWRLMVPLTTSFMGYYPSGWFGLGKSLPSRAAKDWGVFLLKEGSVQEFGRRIGIDTYKDITQKMLLISIDDDLFAPKKSVDILAEKVYLNADSVRKHIVPSDYGIKRLGHFDLFRKKHKEKLWPIVTDWFEK